MNMWHGTGNTPSYCITDSDEGFDLRFSKRAAHGIGNYFAENSSYSTNEGYVSKEPDGTRGVFFAKV